ncbi:MAG TPA: thermonuclease family protein [Burkholderiaceae bacterium]|nr:thermonuclease family protein [Burkholderiaceae bacterium]
MNRFLNPLVRQLSRAGALHRRPAAWAVLAGVLVVAVGVASKAGFVVSGQREAGASDKVAYTLAGRVVHVADGDTFTLLVDGRRERIRMASIDAPETRKNRERPGQPMAQAAKQALAGLVAGKTLALSCFEHDRYGRNVCDVPLPDGSTANRELVAEGLAWANGEGQGRYMRDRRLPGLEAAAREARKGIWSEPSPVPPWVWRYQCWKHGQC